MNAIEAVAAFEVLRKEIGTKADVSVCLGWLDRYGKSPGALSCTIYPDGVGSTRRNNITVHADDFDGLLVTAQKKWAEFSEIHHKRVIRAMALEIIKITADQGHCTDAALRAAHFQAEDVERYGADACADATEIASKGPFSIRIAGRGNAPANLSEEAA